MSNAPAQAAETPEPLLQISNLRVGFSTFAAEDSADLAVDGISLSVGRGEMVGLAGESGSGKSVTALSIPRLLPPQAQILAGSSIRFASTELVGAATPLLRQLRAHRLGVVFQEPMTALHPAQTAGAQLIEALRFRQRPRLGRRALRELAVEMLDSVGVDRPRERLRAWPHELSGGQRQRIVIAMALAGDPDLLLADEPTTALDVSVQMQILELLGDLQSRRRMAVLLISHDLGVVSALTSRMYILRKGRVVETAASDRLVRRPQQPYTRQLLRAVPRADAGHRPARRGEMLLQADRLEVDFRSRASLLPFSGRRFRALEELSLQVHKGETLGVVGESGSGKTTLARALVGLVRARGRLLWKGGPVGPKPARAWRRSVQFVFQDPFGALSPRMTVSQIVGEGLGVHEPGLSRRQRLQRVEEMLGDLGLEASMLQRFPHELSGGQRQRVALARSLVLDPELLILDEPTSALDMSVQAQIVELLKNMQRRRQIAYLFISHDLKLVHALADRVLVLRRGRSVESGEADQIFSRPGQPYTAQLVAAARRYQLPPDDEIAPTT